MKSTAERPDDLTLLLIRLARDQFDGMIEGVEQGGVAVCHAPELREAIRASETAFHNLRSMIEGDDILTLLHEVDNAYTRVTRCASEDHFVKGFLFGFRYLQDMRKEWEDERSNP